MALTSDKQKPSLHIQTITACILSRITTMSLGSLFAAKLNEYHYNLNVGVSYTLSVREIDKLITILDDQ